MQWKKRRDDEWADEERLQRSTAKRADEDRVALQDETGVALQGGDRMHALLTQAESRLGKPSPAFSKAPSKQVERI